MKLTKIHRLGESLDYKYELLLPDELAEWDVWDYWERERLDSMSLNIKRGDLIVYVGGESGWMPALVSKYITPHMILIEPSKAFWNSIHLIWKENELQKPYVEFCGFASNKGRLFSKGMNFKEGEELIIKNEYESLSNKKDIPEVKIDDLPSVAETSAIAIDVEGAELFVLQGAKKILKKLDLFVYVSIHPDLSIKNHGYESSEILTFMEKLGYKSKLLDTTHEEHWVFFKHNLIIKEQKIEQDNI